jgi:hypothetical protein
MVLMIPCDAEARGAYRAWDWLVEEAWDRGFGFRTVFGPNTTAQTVARMCFDLKPDVAGSA